MFRVNDDPTGFVSKVIYRNGVKLADGNGYMSAHFCQKKKKREKIHETHTGTDTVPFGKGSQMQLSDVVSHCLHPHHIRDVVGWLDVWAVFSRRL